MKTIYKYIGLLCMTGSLTFTSCSDSFLQENPLTQSSGATFWKNEADANMGLTACYDALQLREFTNAAYGLGIFGLEAMTDNGGHFNWNGWMQGFQVPMGTQNANTGLFSEYWNNSYELINRCNFLLGNIDPIEMDQQKKAEMKAEALTIRAWAYNNLTMTYQDVPYRTEPRSFANAQTPKTERAKIVENIMADLKSAVEALPQKAARGRVTKGAAYALLGRIALYNEKWDDAISAYQKVMEMGYQLYPDYGKLFTLEGEDNNESIWTVRFEGPGKGEGRDLTTWRTPAEYINGTLNLADDYYMLDGHKTTDTNYGVRENNKVIIGYPNIKHFENRDPRLYATLFVPGMIWNGVGGIDKNEMPKNLQENYSGEIPKDIKEQLDKAYANKRVYGGANPAQSLVYVMKYYDPKNTQNSGDSGQDLYLIRYPEVLLSLAEAYVQKGNYDEAKVISLVNQVRERAKMPKVEDVEGTGLSKDALMDIIKHERRVELAFEGLRIFDLYRWKEWAKAIDNIEYERNSLGLAYEPRMSNGDKDYVWPIPQSELDSNKALEQHPLWK